MTRPSLPTFALADKRSTLWSAAGPLAPWLCGAGLLCLLGQGLAAETALGAAQTPSSTDVGKQAKAPSKPAQGGAPAQPAAPRAGGPLPAAPWLSMKAMAGPRPLDSKTPEALRLAACRGQLRAVLAQNKLAGDSDTPLTLAEINGLESSERERLNGGSGGIICKQEDVKLPAGGAMQRVLVVSSGYQSNHYHMSSVGLFVQTREGWFHETLLNGESWKWYGAGASLEKAQAVGPLVQVQASSNVWSDGNGKSLSSHNESPFSADSYIYVVGVGPSGRPSLTRAIHMSTMKGASRDGAERTASKTCPVTLSPDGELQIGKAVFSRKKMSVAEFAGDDLRTPTGTFTLRPL